MRRRDFIAGLGSAVMCSAAARAQQPAMPVIGFLHSQSLPTYVGPVAAFHRGLAETGYIEGKNVAIDYRWAEGHVDRVHAFAAEMVRKQYGVIAVLGSTPGALALKAATQTVPIVFMIGPDPVTAGREPQPPGRQPDRDVRHQRRGDRKASRTPT